MFLAAAFCGLATLAKGVAGLAIPGVIFVALVAVSGQAKRMLARERLIGVAMAIVAYLLVAVPWNAGMLIRHGMPFWSELYGQNQWKRLTAGVHGNRGTFVYYLRELGLRPARLCIAPPAFSGAVPKERPKRRPRNLQTRSGFKRRSRPRGRPGGSFVVCFGAGGGDLCQTNSTTTSFRPYRVWRFWSVYLDDFGSTVLETRDVHADAGPAQPGAGPPQPDGVAANAPSDSFGCSLTTTST